MVPIDWLVDGAFDLLSLYFMDILRVSKLPAFKRSFCFIGLLKAYVTL